MTGGIPHFRQPIYLLLIVLLLLLVTWLGARGLDADSIWLDEYWSLYNAGGAYLGPRSPLDVLNRIAVEEPWQAPGYYVMLNLWGGMVGWTEFAARSASLLIGLLAVAWTYRLGKDLISPIGGVFAAVLLGTSAYFIYFLHEMRAYSAYVFFIAPMVWAYWRTLKKPDRAGWGVVFVLLVSITGAFYTHYFAALTAVFLGIFHLLFARRQAFGGMTPRLWWKINGVFIIAGLTFLPWAATVMRALGQATEQLGVRGTNALSIEQAVEGVLYLFSNGSTALLVLLLMFSIQRTKQAFFVWFWGLSVLIMLLVINARFGVLLEVRYLLALWTPLAIAAAAGVERLTRYNGWLGVCVICIWVASGIWTSTSPQAAVALHNPHWHLPWRELRSEMTPHVQSGDRAVFLLPDWTWAVYHEDEIRYYLHDLPVEYALMEQPEHIGDDQYQQQAQTILTDASRVWVASTADQPLTHSDDFQSILDRNRFLQCETLASANPLVLELYGKVDENTVSGVSFGPTPLITLTPVGELPTQVSDLASIPMIWTIDDPSVAPLYSFALHLQNADDQLVAQADYGIPQAEQACSVATISVHDLPAGEYTLFATVYAWETGKRLAVQDAGNFTATPDSRIELGRIQVED